ncbi:hypothetical protein PYCCODRAFT_1433441 [Trametes coccinea BRFM310]|uniref:Uncharacterized protein n=1 Tax=Trametes coccinea (strain BRFM310) TaxID=1353009 RepID=A0A1Y2IXB4_TRAC3|nr:hypothetical protein PYCCODRAFT_1433441 [Trametes coccinea BRFM310]
MSQEEHDNFLANVLRNHPSAVYMLPLSGHQLQGQVTAARKTGHHTRLLRAQSSWSDPSRDILIFGKNPKVVEEQYGRIQKRAATGLPWKEIVHGIGIARGLIKEIMAVWALFS